MLDSFSDQVSLKVGPYGCALTFALSPAVADEPASQLATIRVSIEHLKVMSFAFHKAVVEYEQVSGGPVRIPEKALEGLKVSDHEWRAFWEAAK